MTSLRHKTITGMFWSLLQNMGGRGISFIVTIILARVLTPQIFGLIGMLAIFLAVSQAIVIAGFNEALIQKIDTDEEDYSSVFWLNLAISLLIYIALFFLAPLISNFYRQPLLIQLTRILSLVFVINAFSYVQETRLRKDMQFKTLTIIHIPSIILAAAVSIIMALRGFGVWSLVAMQLVSQAAYALQIWVYAKWKPMFVFNRAKLTRLFSFGGKLMFSAILNAIYQNIYLVVIGRFFSVSGVGYYQTANKVVMTPSTTLSSALNSVAFPAFSAIQEDNKRLKEGYKKIIKQLLFWMCPAFVLSAVLATPLFRLVFGSQWLPAVPLFRLLCITGIFYPLNSYNLTIVNVKGRSDIFLRLEVIKKIIVSVGIILVIPFGILALVGFQAVNSIFSYYLNSHYSGRFIQYPMIEQIRDILPVVSLALVAGSAAYLINYGLSDFPDWFRLVCGYSIGGGLYWLIAWSNHFSPYQELVEVIRTKKQFLYR